MTKLNDNEKTMGILTHILMLFAGFVPPLIIYLMTKEKKGFGYENARNALNFAISMFICYIISFILVFVLIGIVLLIALGIFFVIVVIMATIKAANGEVYKYPLTYEFIKA